MTKNGHRKNGAQRWRCNVCLKSFQLEYTYNAHKPGVKEQIIEQTMNSSRVSGHRPEPENLKGHGHRRFKKKSRPRSTPTSLTNWRPTSWPNLKWGSS
ncbi:MAG: hypothetical protein IPM82_24955 [Saprospiraceae bacterium]|nr:hypothetical protein [Saprospiraceae bacterium]